MTQLIHEPLTAGVTLIEPVSRARKGVVFVPCVICRAPVDLAAVTEANDAPVCGRHFVTELPPLH